MMPKRDWMEMTWTDVAAGDTRRWIAVLPVAAIEQHGPHLPLGVDSYIAEAYIARVLPLLPADLPATFLPVQKIGQSDEHLAFPGTLSFSARTIIGAYTEIGESLYRSGVRKLVIVTSHGGNVSTVELVARDLRVRLKMLVVTCAWHRFGYPPGTFERMEQRHGVHAGDVETSLVLAHKPETVHMEYAVPAIPATVEMAESFKWLSAFRPVGFGWMSQDLHPTGAIGNATRATAQKGEQALAHGARAFVELLQDVDRFDLKRLADGPPDNPVAHSGE
ncbi:MAG TPA: creatininase family protein [Xanthobacteraceae bacterium]|nr:creatininase family protein [Xanthobacteraceae bacterium]